MTLTEKWKKSELEAGWYYVLLFSNEEYITFIDGNWVVDDRLIGADIKEVLAPVPSYKEWQKLHQYTRNCVEEIKILREQLDVKNGMVDALLLEDQQLKELLKECKETIETSVWGNCSALTDQIDEVIGEKK